MWYSFLRTVFEGNCIMEDVLSPYDRAYPADTRKPKAYCCSRYEADSKVTGAHRVNRPLPYGKWRRLYQLRDKEWSDRLGKKVVA